MTYSQNKSDHLHLFVGARPTSQPCKIVNQLKGNTSIHLRRCFPDLRYLGYKQHYGKEFVALCACGNKILLKSKVLQRKPDQQPIDMRMVV